MSSGGGKPFWTFGSGRGSERKEGRGGKRRKNGRGDGVEMMEGGKDKGEKVPLSTD